MKKFTVRSLKSKINGIKSILNELDRQECPDVVYYTMIQDKLDYYRFLLQGLEV